MSKTSDIGAAGERAAVEWLRVHRFIIMDTNWRLGRYEIDIVASRGDRVHFVEVKLRKAGGLTTPEEAMTPVKCKALLRAANLYIEQYNVTLDCQIDLVAIDYTDDGRISVRYVPDAVNPKW